MLREPVAKSKDPYKRTATDLLRFEHLPALPWNAGGKVGVLRLRDGFAIRSHPSAQDDNIGLRRYLQLFVDAAYGY